MVFGFAHGVNSFRMKSPTDRVLSPRELRLLRALLEYGTPNFAKLAELEGISRERVRQLAERLALEGRWKPTPRTWAIYKRVNKLESADVWDRIAALTEFNKGQQPLPKDKYAELEKQWAKHRVEARAETRVPSSAERDAQIVRMVKAGRSVIEVAREHGIDRNRVYQIVWDAEKKAAPEGAVEGVDPQRSTQEQQTAGATR